MPLKFTSILDYQEAIDQVTEALRVKEFGGLTRIDVKATLKEKLDVDFRLMGSWVRATALEN